MGSIISRSSPIDTSIFELIQIRPSAPGAGNDFSYICPANTRLELLFISGQLTNAAALSGHAPDLKIVGDGSLPVKRSLWRTSISGLIGSYPFTFVQGNHLATSIISPSTVLYEFGREWFMIPGWDLTLEFTNMTGDVSLSKFSLLFKRWVLP